MISPGKGKHPDSPERVVICFFKDVIDHFLAQGIIRKHFAMGSEMGEHPLYILPIHEQEVGLLQQARFAAVIAAVEGIRVLGASVPSGMFDALTEQLDRMRVDLDVVVSRGDPSLRRLGELADLVVSCCLGIVGDRLLTDPRGFGAIDDLDFRDWLRLLRLT